MTEEEDQWEDAPNYVIHDCESSTGMMKEDSQWTGLHPQSHHHAPEPTCQMRPLSSAASVISARSSCSKGRPINFKDERTSEQRSECNSSYEEERGRCLYSSTYKCVCNEHCAEMTHSAMHARPCPCCGGQREPCCKTSRMQTHRINDKSKLKELIDQSEKKGEGCPTLYQLKPKEQILSVHPTIKRKTFGERDREKTQKNILMVGGTGPGKSKLINTMVNYILGVKPEDKVWFDITGENKGKMTESQTSHVTVYDVFVKESSHSLTIIDTPGFGDTRWIGFDEMISESLLNLCRMKDGVKEVDAVCLVVKASENRLSEREHYIFDSVVSLFGKDIEKNIVLLITHSSGASPDALQAITETRIPCPLNKKNQPVHFLFDNWQEQTYDDDNVFDYRIAWDRGERSMKNFLEYLKTMEKRSLRMTEGVLRKSKQLKACFSNLLERVQWIEFKQEELKQKKDALEEFRKDDRDFEVEIDEVYKEKVPINSPWWHLSKTATCCTVCEENCHYPGCWWVKDLSWCSVMKDGKCTVCTNKCDYTKHVKEEKIYESKTRRIKKNMEDLKMQYMTTLGERKSLLSKLKDDLRRAKEEKTRLIEEAYQSIINLEEIALNPDPYSTPLHLDFLIEKMRETGNKERIQKLIDIRKRADDQKIRVAYFRAIGQRTSDLLQMGQKIKSRILW